MKIATWNVERLKHKKDLEAIRQNCVKQNADILVLTETDRQIDLDYQHIFSTPSLIEIAPTYYQPTEHRVSIFSRFPCVKVHDTHDKYTSLCVELETPWGNLHVYGTIMGIYGNREKSFRPDVEKQVSDIRNFANEGKHLCVVGDYNCSFCDNYYFTKWARSTLLNTFSDSELVLLTSNAPECIDHIAVSREFLGARAWQVDEWNKDKKFSDHKGISVEFG
ncbi:MAG: hypothetical protein R3Y07_05950 [Eubacteriales bacterium]